jgi:hemerythrin
MDLHWESSLATGNAVIDKQHQELFKRMENLLEAVNGAQGTKAVTGAITFLEDYAFRHFRAEENIQRKNNFPEYESHKEQHRIFMDDIAKLRGDLDRQGVSPELQLKAIASVGNWICNHINKRDKSLAAYLQRLDEPVKTT